MLLSETVFVRHAALGDLDGDGDLDIAITRVDNSGNGSISIRLNNGSGSFGGATIIAAGDFSPDKLVLGDVTRDGRLDILTTNSDLGSFTVLVNTSGGVFELPRNFAAVSVAGLALGNLNGDNKPDVVIVDGNSSLLVSLNADNARPIPRLGPTGSGPSSARKSVDRHWAPAQANAARALRLPPATDAA